MRRFKDVDLLVLTSAEIEQRRMPFSKNEVVVNSDTNELRGGPGAWDEMDVLIRPTFQLGPDGNGSPVSGGNAPAMMIYSTDETGNPAINQLVPASGRLLYISDTERLYVGDGIKTVLEHLVGSKYLVPKRELK